MTKDADGKTSQAKEPLNFLGSERMPFLVDCGRSHFESAVREERENKSPEAGIDRRYLS